MWWPTSFTVTVSLTGNRDSVPFIPRQGWRVQLSLVRKALLFRNGAYPSPLRARLNRARISQSSILVCKSAQVSLCRFISRRCDPSLGNASPSSCLYSTVLRSCCLVRGTCPVRLAVFEALPQPYQHKRRKLDRQICAALRLADRVTEPTRRKLYLLISHG
jgi:hypothetical protein